MITKVIEYYLEWLADNCKKYCHINGLGCLIYLLEIHRPIYVLHGRMSVKYFHHINRNNILNNRPNNKLHQQTVYCDNELQMPGLMPMRRG